MTDDDVLVAEGWGNSSEMRCDRFVLSSTTSGSAAENDFATGVYK